MKSSRKFVKYLITAIFILAGLLCLALYGFLTLKGYPESARFIYRLLHKPLTLTQFTEQYFTPTRYAVLSWLTLAFSGFFLLSAFFVYRAYYKIETLVFAITQRVKSEAQKISDVFAGLNLPQKAIGIGTLVLIAALKLYFLWWFPAHTDEVYSYLFFVDRGFLTTLSYYPVPNNHVFFNLICWFFNLTGLPPLLVMRLPAFIAGLLVSLVLFALVKKEFDFKAAYLSSVFFSLSHFTIYFSVHGRGYMQLCFLVLLAAFALLHFLRRGCRFYLVVFIVSSALGFYTIPVFAFPFFSFIVFGAGYLSLKKQYPQLSVFLGSVMVTGIIVTILYAPILFTAGLNGLIGKDIREVQSKAFTPNVLPYLNTLLDDYTGLQYLGFIIPCFNLLLLCYACFGNKNRVLVSKNRDILLFFNWMVVSPLLLIFMLQLLPPGRVWLYWSSFNYILFAVGLLYIFDVFFKNRKASFIFILAFAVLFGFFQVTRLKQKVTSGQIQVFSPLPAIIPQIVSSNAKAVYVEHEFYNMFILFGRKYTQQPISTDIYKLRKNADYDYVLVLKENSFPAQLDSARYKFIFSDHKVKAYRRLNF